MSTVLLIPAAGSGTRLAAGVPKAFVPLVGRSLLAHAVEGAVRSGVIDAIVVAAPSSLIEDARRIAETAAEVPAGPPAVPITVVEGGADRVVSVAAALAAVPEADLVLVHDAARCLTPASVYHRVVGALAEGAAAVVPVLPVTDTVKTATDAGTVVGDLDRTALRRIQTPQGFVRDVLVAAHELQRTDPDATATDDAGLVERLDIAVVGVAGDEAALKITHPLDLRIAEMYVTGELDEAQHDPSQHDPSQSEPSQYEPSPYGAQLQDATPHTADARTPGHARRRSE